MCALVSVSLRSWCPARLVCPRALLCVVTLLAVGGHHLTELGGLLHLHRARKERARGRKYTQHMVGVECRCAGSRSGRMCCGVVCMARNRIDSAPQHAMLGGSIASIQSSLSIFYGHAAPPIADCILAGRILLWRSSFGGHQPIRQGANQYTCAIARVGLQIQDSTMNISVSICFWCHALSSSIAALLNAMAKCFLRVCRRLLLC